MAECWLFYATFIIGGRCKTLLKTVCVSKAGVLVLNYTHTEELYMLLSSKPISTSSFQFAVWLAPNIHLLLLSLELLTFFFFNSFEVFLKCEIFLVWSYNMDMKIAKVSKPWFLTWSGLIFPGFLSCLFLHWYIFFIIFVLVYFLPFGSQNCECTHYYLSEVDEDVLYNVQELGVLFINLLLFRQILVCLTL